MPRIVSMFIPVIALITSACGPMDGGAGPEESGSWSVGGWSLAKTCTHDDCSGAMEECDRQLADCDRCYHDCEGYDGYLGSACSGCSYCGHLSACNCHPSTTCAFTFTNGTPVDEDIRAACEANWQHGADCGGGSAPPDACEHFARAERAEVVAAYQCSTEAMCGADTSSCGPEPVPALADVVCTRASCSTGLRTLLDGESGWSSDTSVAALHLCDQQMDDAQYADCAKAWVREVYGSLAGRYSL